MKKKMVLGVTVLIMIIVSACSKADPGSDFKVMISSFIDVGEAVEITGYVGTKLEVRIPSKIQKLPVVVIRSKAFYGKKLTSVTIPKSVIAIRDAAFAENQLTNVTIPNSVTSIGIRAFTRNQLNSVTIPDSVTSIEGSAFAENQLTKVTIPKSVINLNRSAFDPDVEILRQ